MGSRVKERGGGRAGWIGELREGERRRQGWMHGGVGLGREEGAGLDGWGSVVRERGSDRAGWRGEWSDGEKSGQGWRDGGVG